MELTKVEGDTVFTPIVTLNHDNRYVTVCGIIHIGTPAYFSGISNLIASKEAGGWQVLYERLYDSTDVPGSSELRQLAEEVIRLQYELVQLFLNRYGLIHQSQCLSPSLNWIDADLPSKTRSCVRLSTIEQLQSKKKEILERLTKPDEVISCLRLEILNPQVTRNRVERMKSDVRESLIGDRDRVAVTKIISCCQTCSVITFWGSAHVWGIVEGLISSGFVVESIDWLPAMSL